MSGLTDDEKKVVSDLSQKFEDVASFRTKSGDLIVVRKCNPAERSRLVDRISDQKSGKQTSTMSATMKELTLSCVVYPEKDTARGLLERYPALYDKFANRAYELAGGDVEELGKD